MPHDDLEAEMHALITELKEIAERTLAAVREAKAAAQDAGLLDIYRAAVRREQQILDALKAMGADDSP